MRSMLLVVLVAALPAAGAPRKTRPAEPPASCDAWGSCVAAIDAAFEATEFERAQRLARQAEAFAATPEHQALLLVLLASLDVHSAPGVSAIEEAARARFQEARRLDPNITVLAIPPYARSEKLERLWDAVAPKPGLELTPPPPTVLVTSPVTPPLTSPVAAPRRVPVLALSLAGAAVVAAISGTVLGVASRSTVAQRALAFLDVDRFTLTQTAQTLATGANIAFALTGGAALTALFTWLFFE